MIVLLKTVVVGDHSCQVPIGSTFMSFGCDLFSVGMLDGVRVKVGCVVERRIWIGLGLG